MTGDLAAQGGMAALCLLAVLAAILGAARLVRAIPALSRANLTLRAPDAPPSPLCITATVALDRTRRLHLVDAAGRSALILTGATGDVMIELGHPG